MGAPHGKYADAPKVPHGTSGTNSPCAMRSWKCRITGYRERQRVAIGRLETRRFGSLRIDAEGKRVLLCACPSFSNPVRLCLNSKKSPGFLRGRGTLAVSGLTRNVAFGPRGFVLPFQISRLVWPAYYIPPGKLPCCF